MLLGPEDHDAANMLEALVIHMSFRWEDINPTKIKWLNKD